MIISFKMRMVFLPFPLPSLSTDQYKDPSIGIRFVGVTRLAGGDWVFDSTREIDPDSCTFLICKKSLGPYNEATAPRFVKKRIKL